MIILSLKIFDLVQGYPQMMRLSRVPKMYGLYGFFFKLYGLYGFSYWKYTDFLFSLISANFHENFKKKIKMKLV